MAVNKVMDSVGNVLIDLTNDTITPDKVLQGYTFHDRSGQAQTGTLATIPQGSGAYEEDNVVRFVDYDGTVIAAYSIAEANALQTLPTPPAHEHLIFECWNHTLQQVQETTHSLCVGALYNTVDDAAYITFQMPISAINNAARVYLNVITAGTITIDWGDNNSEEITFSSTGTNKSVSHIYTSANVYTIKITKGTADIQLYSSTSSSGTRFIDVYSLGRGTLLEINFPTWQSYYNSTYHGYVCFRDCYQLQKISIGSHFAGFQDYAFSGVNSRTLCIIFNENCRPMLSASSINENYSKFLYISFPKIMRPTMSVSSVSFDGALKGALKSAILPDYLYNSNNEILVNSCSFSIYNYSMTYLYTGLLNVTNVSINTFTAHCLKKIEGNYKISTSNILLHGYAANELILKMTTFNPGSSGNINLGKVEILKFLPEYTTFIGITSQAYQWGALKYIDLSLYEAPPTLQLPSSTSQYYFSFKIKVMAGTLSLYQTATNWSVLYSYGLIEEATA